MQVRTAGSGRGQRHPENRMARWVMLALVGALAAATRAGEEREAPSAAVKPEKPKAEHRQRGPPDVGTQPYRLGGQRAARAV